MRTESGLRPGRGAVERVIVGSWVALGAALALATTSCGGGGSVVGGSASTRSSTASTGVIAFVNDDPSSSHEQIFLENADGSDARPLVTSRWNDVAPAISPDGRTVVFTRMDDPNPDRIFEVDVDGSGLHQLVPDGCPAGDRCGDAVEGHPWSPDGTEVVFTRALFRGDARRPFQAALWVMNADGTGAHQVTLAGGHCGAPCPGGAQDDNAGWLPDGSGLYFRRWEYGPPETFAVYTVALDGSDVRRVTPTSLRAEDPAWSPDGDEVIFQAPPDPFVAGAGTQTLYAIHLDGSGLRALTTHLAGDATNHPCWSPDGSTIVFSHAQPHEVADLWEMDADGGNAHPLATTRLNENAPDWGNGPS